jgi:hypothetical protein
MKEKETRVASILNILIYMIYNTKGVTIYTKKNMVTWTK